MDMTLMQVGVIIALGLTGVLGLGLRRVRRASASEQGVSLTVISRAQYRGDRADTPAEVDDELLHAGEEYAELSSTLGLDEDERNPSQHPLDGVSRSSVDLNSRVALLDRQHYEVVGFSDSNPSSEPREGEVLLAESLRTESLMAASFGRRAYKQSREQSHERAALLAEIKFLEKRAANAERDVETLQFENSEQTDLLKSQTEALQNRQLSLSDLEDARRALAEAELALATETASLTSRSQQLQSELASSRERAEHLNLELSKAQAQAAAAGETDLELRRVRGELAALQEQQKRVLQRATEIDQQARDNNGNIIDRGRLEALESEVTQRDRLIAELEQRLADASSRQPEVIDVGAKAANGQVVHEQLFERPETVDDLKQIKGIGPVMESVLNELGVTSFQQVAQFSACDVAKVAAEINTFPGRIERDDWIGGAQREYQLKYKELAAS